MGAKDLDAKERILEGTIALLDETGDVEKITVRQIAERAGVGVGLINYHFGSRDHLLRQAIGTVMAKMAGDLLQGSAKLEGDGTERDGMKRLKEMLKALYAFGTKHEKLIQFTLTYGLLNGELETALYLVPLLREIRGEEVDEMQLRIMALQILLPIQVTALNPAAFRIYSGVDLHVQTQRDAYIELLVDQVVNGKERSV